MLTIIQGMEELKRKLNDFGRKQVPFATARSITLTAKSVEKKIQSDMDRGFKLASPFVKRATFSTSATKSNLTAMVGLKDQKPPGGTAPAVLLKQHFTGGLRGHKPFEKAIQALGVMPQGWRAMPGAGMRLDAYGNPRRGDIGEMLGALRSNTKIWKGRGKKMALTGYFIIPVNAQSHLQPGVYKRIGHDAIKPMFLFVPQAAYQKIFDMERGAREVVDHEFQPNFDKAFAEAIRTAR